jgi:hypothetical protein
MKRVKTSAKNCAIKDIKMHCQQNGITEIALDFNMFGTESELLVSWEDLA